MGVKDDSGSARLTPMPQGGVWMFKDKAEGQRLEYCAYRDYILMLSLTSFSALYKF